MKLRNQLIKLVVGLLLSGIVGNAQALTMRWSFSDTTFYDGTSVTGYFDYDTGSNNIVNRNIITQDGSLPGFTYNMSNNSYSGQDIDPLNAFLFESLITFQTPRVDVDANTQTERRMDIINWESSGFTFDLSQVTTYVFLPLGSAIGYDFIRTWNFDDTGAYIGFSDTTRYFDAVTLTSQILSPVPEPETYGMLLAGLGLIGFIATRRKNQNTTMNFA